MFLYACPVCLQVCLPVCVYVSVCMCGHTRQTRERFSWSVCLPVCLYISVCMCGNTDKRAFFLVCLSACLSVRLCLYVWSHRHSSWSVCVPVCLPKSLSVCVVTQTRERSSWSVRRPWDLRSTSSSLTARTRRTSQSQLLCFCLKFFVLCFKFFFVL